MEWFSKLRSSSAWLQSWGPWSFYNTILQPGTVQDRCKQPATSVFEAFDEADIIPDLQRGFSASKYRIWIENFCFSIHLRWIQKGCSGIVLRLNFSFVADLSKLNLQLVSDKTAAAQQFSLDRQDENSIQNSVEPELSRLVDSTWRELGRVKDLTENRYFIKFVKT